MIRINLLPIRAAKKRQHGRLQLMVGGVLLLAECLVLLFLFQSRTQERKNLESRVLARQQEETARQQIQAEVNELESQLTQLGELTAAMQTLEAARTGPVGVLDALKRMINRPANAADAREQRELDWNMNWQPESVWISSFVEIDDTVTITGAALTVTDAAEFAIRISSSDHFSMVRLGSHHIQGEDSPIGANYDFEITAILSYAIYADEEEG